MAWKMDSHGVWTQTEGSGTKNSNSKSKSKTNSKNNSSDNKVATDKGNTADTEDGLSSTTSNKSDEVKYAEEANFSMLGNHEIHKGGTITVRNGVADRWKGDWQVLETTHTFDIRGYKTEGILGRIPYREVTEEETSNSGNSNSSKSSNDNSKSSSKTNTKESKPKTKTDKSGQKWKMDSSGKWVKVNK